MGAGDTLGMNGWLIIPVFKGIIEFVGIMGGEQMGLQGFFRGTENDFEAVEP